MNRKDSRYGKEFNLLQKVTYPKRNKRRVPYERASQKDKTGSDK